MRPARCGVRAHCVRLCVRVCECVCVCVYVCCVDITQRHTRHACARERGVAVCVRVHMV